MAATSIPQLVAYAETVGYASYRGLATAGPSLFAWGLATGSPFMSCGVTSITALMAKADLDGESYISEHGEEEYVKLVASYSLWVGLCSALLGIFGFGKLASLVPSTVRKGFKVSFFISTICLLLILIIYYMHAIRQLMDSFINQQSSLRFKHSGDAPLESLHLLFPMVFSPKDLRNSNSTLPAPPFRT